MALNQVVVFFEEDFFFFFFLKFIGLSWFFYTENQTKSNQTEPVIFARIF